MVRINHARFGRARREARRSGAEAVWVGSAGPYLRDRILSSASVIHERRDLDGNDQRVGAAEVRLEARSGGRTPVLMGGVQVAVNDCFDSLPPVCTFPAGAGLQLRAGAAAPYDMGIGELAFVPSVGTVRWGGDWDWTVRFDAVVRPGVGQGVQLELGVRQDWLWISRRSEDVATGARRVDSIGLVFGLRFSSDE